jgi:hypothetical protein
MKILLHIRFQKITFLQNMWHELKSDALLLSTVILYSKCSVTRKKDADIRNAPSAPKA